MTILETERLRLREATAADAPFFLALLNDPDWIRFIGDRGARTVDDARYYVEEKLIASYRRHGFGLWVVDVKESGESAGICGLVRRDALDDVDVGFAFLPAHRGKGYATEATIATMAHARRVLGLGRLVAITVPENRGSIRVLERAGMVFEREIRWAADGSALALYAQNADGPGEPGARRPEGGR
jgi:RimJ/RimL family protein N-acetyltransferase